MTERLVEKILDSIFISCCTGTCSLPQAILLLKCPCQLLRTHHWCSRPVQDQHMLGVVNGLRGTLLSIPPCGFLLLVNVAGIHNLALLLLPNWKQHSVRPSYSTSITIDGQESKSPKLAMLSKWVGKHTLYHLSITFLSVSCLSGGL